MSAAQAIASSRFLTAMGPMIEDEEKMNEVLEYIESIKVSPLSSSVSRSCSLDEFSDLMARDLGKRYGLNDIREAR